MADELGQTSNGREGQWGLAPAAAACTRLRCAQPRFFGTAAPDKPVSQSGAAADSALAPCGALRGPTSRLFLCVAHFLKHIGPTLIDVRLSKVVLDPPSTLDGHFCNGSAWKVSRLGLVFGSVCGHFFRKQKWFKRLIWRRLRSTASLTVSVLFCVNTTSIIHCSNWTMIEQSMLIF